MVSRRRGGTPDNRVPGPLYPPVAGLDHLGGPTASATPIILDGKRVTLRRQTGILSDVTATGRR
jgi:hypothetical protein